MSVVAYKEIIEEGDLVLIYVSRNTLKPITVTKGECLNTRFGSFPHDSMIGLPYGSQLLTPEGKGFVYLLHPTAELWTQALPHRTQIVYTPDSSYIVQRMDVMAGSRVIEAGTGSGSFTHAFARTIGEEGHLFTYEFHEARYEKAQKEFQEHLLGDIVTITHRDVCKDGFEVEGADICGEAVFLDLPSPWEAIPNLEKVIDQGKQVHICCFSPCVEQVVQTVEALHQNGWTKIEMTEVSSMRWEARKAMIRDVSEAVKRLEDVKKRQIEGIEELKKKAEAAQKEREARGITEEEAEAEAEHQSKKRKFKKGPKPVDRDRGYNPFGKGKRVAEGDPEFEWFDVSKGEPEVKSHTSYLTFAIKVPQLTPGASI